jgi:hypothetical protein
MLRLKEIVGSPLLAMDGKVLTERYLGQAEEGLRRVPELQRQVKMKELQLQRARLAAVQATGQVDLLQVRGCHQSLPNHAHRCRNRERQKELEQFQTTYCVTSGACLWVQTHLP